MEKATGVHCKACSSASQVTPWLSREEFESAPLLRSEQGAARNPQGVTRDIRFSKIVLQTEKYYIVGGIYSEMYIPD